MRLRLKAGLARASGDLGVAGTVLAACRWLRPPAFLTAVNYHRVDDPQAVAEVDAGVLDATPESLDRQMGILRRHFTPIALADLVGHLEGRPLPPNPAFVTFDDGYLDNVRTAVPILQRHGIRATFFVTTAYIEERRLFWWDRVSWILKHARRPRFSLSRPEAGSFDLGAGVARAERRLQRMVWDHGDLDLEGFLDDLAVASDAPWGPGVEADLVRRHVMTWDDVRALRQAGMDVGSHTRTHRVLLTVPTGHLAAELAGSRADLERQIGEPIVAVAYPVGWPVAGVPAIREAVAEAGYRLGFTYDTGRQDLAALDAFDVHRYSVERDTPGSSFLAQLAFPWLVPSPPACSVRSDGGGGRARPVPR